MRSVSEEEVNPTPPPPLMPPPPSPDELPAPPPLPPMGELPPPPPIPGMPLPPPMPEMPAPPQIPVMQAPPPIPEMPAPPPIPVMQAPPPMPEMPAPPPMPEMPAPPPMPVMPAPPPMPEMPAPVAASSESADEHVELPDPLAALDILSTVPTETEAVDPMPAESTTSDLLASLDSTPIREDEGDAEHSVADYKWKDSVLEAIIEKFDITDRDAFLVHATAFDENKNLYITKKEFTEAAKEWVELTTPIAELPSVEETHEMTMDTTLQSESMDDVEQVPVINTPPVIIPPPMPEPAPELPPLPTPPVMELPPLPTPPVMDLPPLPAPSPVGTVEIQESIEIDAIKDGNTNEQTEDYRELWKRRSDKSLPQMYGAIDRIGSGEIGSLLDRYSDRFGHELDREIIVMRRAEQDARREAVPVVELISAPDESEEDDELKIQLNEVEDILRPLQNAYKAAEEKAEKKRLAPALKVLIAERKILLSVISGEANDDLLDDIPERPEIPDYGESDDDQEDIEVSESTDEFAEFFNIINQLLGEMPEDWVNNFVEGKGFALFQKIGTDPEGADDKSRKKFFNMINNELGSMPDDMLDAFISSPEFDLYKTMGEMYGA